MSASVSLDELVAAYDWVSAGAAAAIDSEAYINRQTGSVHWVGDGVDEEPPEDIEDGTRYIAVPKEFDFNLGRPVALRFANEHLPQHLEAVHGFFRKGGACAKFKSLLARTGQLDAWHEYEDAATESALREWCEANDLDLVA